MTMDQENPADVARQIRQQKEFFLSHQTRAVDFRIDALKKLRDAIKQYESRIVDALKQDLRKPEFEAHETEISMVTAEVRHHLKKVRSWAAPERVRTSLLNFPAKSMIYPEPYGVALVIAPWNYPFQLQMLPVVGAISAGNCVVLKPSECAPATSQAIYDLVNEHFDPKYISVYQGGKEITQELLRQDMDYIFFTGGTVLGKVIMKAAAEHLTPVTLELGGKSPCIVDKDANLQRAAKRIIWGKFLNAGQTCVAPDYLYVHSEVRETLVKMMIDFIGEFYGEDPKESPDYPRIINERHFERLTGLLEHGKIITGGQTDRSDKYVAPTLLSSVTADDPVMQDEIFGPILPVFEFDNLYAVIDFINSRPKPLALYYFSENKEKQREIVDQVSFGGGCINETIMHLGNPSMPFGGIGGSGMGCYHGKHSFDEFTHYKPVLRKSTKIDFSLRYPPYKGKLGKLKWFM